MLYYLLIFIYCLLSFFHYLFINAYMIYFNWIKRTYIMYYKSLINKLRMSLIFSFLTFLFYWTSIVTSFLFTCVSNLFSIYLLWLKNMFESMYSYLFLLYFAIFGFKIIDYKFLFKSTLELIYPWVHRPASSMNPKQVPERSAGGDLDWFLIKVNTSKRTLNLTCQEWWICSSHLQFLL